MILIILSIILTALLFISTTKFGRELVEFERQISKSVIALGLVPLLFGFITVIPANNVGVLYSPFTGTQQTTLQEGIKFKSPIDKVYKFSTEIQTQTISNLYGQTKDAQYITMTVDVKYSVDKAHTMLVFQQFRNISKVNENLITPVTQRSIEEVVSKYSIINILGEERNAVYEEIELALTERLAKSGISFYSVTFLDTDAGTEIESAIRQEAIVAKQVETAKQEKEKSKIEAEKLQIETQAKADAKILESKALAQQLEIEAQGKLRSYQIKSEALNESVLFLEWLDKWNGELPRVQGQTGNILDISEYLNQ